MMAGISARLSRRGRTAVLIGGIGYAWSLALVFRPACSAMLKPSAEDQQPYAPPGDSHYGDENAVFTRLKGWLPTFRRTRKHACWYGMAIWRDKGPLVRGRGPSNGANVTYWVTETINGQAFMARYSFDLSYLVEPGTGAIGFSHSAQHDENTRLIERIPPPTPGPARRSIAATIPGAAWPWSSPTAGRRPRADAPRRPESSGRPRPRGSSGEWRFR